jgi:hypothetical protein
MDAPLDGETKTKLLEAAKAVLAQNDLGSHTVPSHKLYPHQWLWDSCFIAIGLSHVEVDRAQMELKSLTRGQWSNGMLPSMIFASGESHWQDRTIWRSWLSPHGPDHYATTGITQPPMLAEAVVRVGKKLSKGERRTWYQTMYPSLLAYHQWLYNERDPHHEGLVLQIHPWEIGLDNTPPWMKELYDHQLPTWVRVVGALHLDKPLTLMRRDTRFVMPGQRISTRDAIAFYSIQRRLRRKNYDIDRILTHSFFAIEDVTFNCILIRANHHLRNIAKTIKKDLPKELTEAMTKSEEALEQLWDAYTGQYYSRNFVTHKPIKEPSIATLMPLYAGNITKERASQLVKMLHNKKLFGAKYPIPSVPLNSDWFKPHAYWQGPTWINTNWLVADGLERYGFKEEAEAIRFVCLELVSEHGFYEYFSPLDGSPAGIKNFSWSAALTIDLLS